MPTIPVGVVTNMTASDALEKTLLDWNVEVAGYWEMESTVPWRRCGNIGHESQQHQCLGIVVVVVLATRAVAAALFHAVRA